MSCRVFIVLTSLIAFSDSARILGVVPTPSYSHQVVFRPIWKELAKKGHDLIVITTDPENDPSQNFTEIDISLAYDFWNGRNVVKMMDIYKDDIFSLHEFMTNVTTDILTVELDHPEVQKLLKNKTEHFDLIIIEYLYPVMTALSERFRCPYVGVTSMEPPNLFFSVLGQPIHPVLQPDIFLRFSGDMHFWQRLKSTLFQWLIILSENTGAFETTTMQQLKDKYFGENLPSTKDIMSNASLLLVNEDPTFNTRPFGPNVVLFGGGAHLQPLKLLPKDLKDYLDSATNGFIYFSLGTNVKSDIFPPEMRKAVLDTFRELPYKVLWKFDVADIPDVPDNVKIVNWAPQQDILRHPKILLFITQGGLQSTEEAIFSHVPMVGIPYIADQDTNVHKKIVERGCGVYLDKNSLTKEFLKEAILQVVNDPKYKQNTIRIAELSKDQPTTGIEKAIWWIEYVIRHKGARHLRSQAIDLPLYQYLLLDVIGFLLAVVLVLLYIICKAFKFIKFQVSKLRLSIVKRQKTE